MSHEELTTFLERLEPGPESGIGHGETHSPVVHFFSDSTLSQLLSLRSALLPYLDKGTSEGRDAEIATYALACILGILHGPSQGKRETLFLSLNCNHAYAQSPNYVAEYAKKFGLVKPDKDVLSCILAKSALVQKSGLPPMTGSVVEGNLLDLAIDEPANLIVTSPPYFRAQSYAWDNWLRLWMLGYQDYREVRRKLLETSSIRSYSEAMRLFLVKMKSLLVDGSSSRVVVVVGDVRVDHGRAHNRGLTEDVARRYLSIHPTRGPMINTSEIVADAAVETGFEVENIVIDSIRDSSRVLRSFLSEHHGSRVDRIVVLKRVSRATAGRRAPVSAV